MARCGIVILAAGGSSRMGSAKQLLEFEGRTLLLRAIETAMASVCRPIVVILGARALELRPLLEDSQITIVENERWETGIGSSIRCGIAELATADVGAAIIFLCDQPLISAPALDHLVTAHASSGKWISAAKYAGDVGTPAVFSRILFDELLNLPPSHGGKALMKKYPDQVHAVELPEAAIDVDTPADFENLSKKIVR